MTESGAAVSPFLYQATLYYTREADGRFVYRGQAERWDDGGDPRMELNGVDYCDRSFETR